MLSETQQRQDSNEMAKKHSRTGEDQIIKSPFKNETPTDRQTEWMKCRCNVFLLSSYIENELLICIAFAWHLKYLT